MSKVILKFPDVNEFHKFIKYLKMPECVTNIEDLEIICSPDPVEIEIAIKIFNARVLAINTAE